MHVIEETEYPFRDTVRITINPSKPANFPLQLRIPAWANGATIHINGVAQANPKAATFARIERDWKHGDIVELRLPLEPRFLSGYKDSVSIERGPLVFSYPIGESWVKLQDRGMTADWQIFPSTSWNYALSVDRKDASTLAVHEQALGSSPFSLKGTPVTMQVKAHKLNEWRAIDGVADPVPQSPVTSDQPEELITLVPYAAAKLRVTSFPYTKEAT